MSADYSKHTVSQLQKAAVFSLDRIEHYRRALRQEQTIFQDVTMQQERNKHDETLCKNLRG